MIKFNEIYSINNGQESIEFKEGKGNTIIGEYNDGTLTGTIDGNTLTGTFHNKKSNGAGLIEITFHENGFEAKWKQGLEPGPMRGKWLGSIGGSDENTQHALKSLATAEKYLEYLKKQNKSFQERLVKSSPAELVEIFSFEFEEEYFGDLKNHIDILKFRVDNSDVSIDENGGADHISIIYDLVNNCIYCQSDDSDDEIYRYLYTYDAGINEYYEEKSLFYGCYSVSNLENDWTLSFHGDSLEDTSGNIDQDLLLQIKANMNAKSIYNFLTEVLDCF